MMLSVIQRAAVAALFSFWSKQKKKVCFVSASERSSLSTSSSLRVLRSF